MTHRPAPSFWTLLALLLRVLTCGAALFAAFALLTQDGVLFGPFAATAGLLGAGAWLAGVIGEEGRR